MAKKIKIEHWPIGKVLPYAQNARLHSPDQIKIIANSMREFGFVNPALVDGAGVLIAGHGRTLAAKSLGMTEIPVIQLGYLTDAQVMALRLADNAIALNGSSWDAEMLQTELGQLQELNFDLTPLGLDQIELPDLEESTEITAPKPVRSKTTIFISVKNADAVRAKKVIGDALKKAKIESSL